ncbi:MAG: hypothetical protein NVS2B4_21890 [Ramlibacter sp.]
MKTHQQRSPLCEIETQYEIAVREHGPQGRSTRMLKQALDRELERRPEVRAQAGEKAAEVSGRRTR